MKCLSQIYYLHPTQYMQACASCCRYPIHLHTDQITPSDANLTTHDTPEANWETDTPVTSRNELTKSPVHETTRRKLEQTRQEEPASPVSNIFNYLLYFILAVILFVLKQPHCMYIVHYSVTADRTINNTCRDLGEAVRLLSICQETICLYLETFIKSNSTTWDAVSN